MKRPICCAPEEMLVHGDLWGRASRKKSVKTAALHYDPRPNPLLLVQRTHMTLTTLKLQPTTQMQTSLFFFYWSEVLQRLLVCVIKREIKWPIPKIFQVLKALSISAQLRFNIRQHSCYICQSINVSVYKYTNYIKKCIYTVTSLQFLYCEKGQYFLSLISESETHILYRFITQN